MADSRKYKLSLPEGVAHPSPGSPIDELLQKVANQTGVGTIGPKTYNIVAALAGTIAEAKRRYPGSHVGNAFTFKTVTDRNGKTALSYGYDTSGIPPDVMESIEAANKVPGAKARVTLPSEAAMRPTGVLPNLRVADVGKVAADAFTGKLKPVAHKGVTGLVRNAGQEIAAIPHGLASLASVPIVYTQEGLAAARAEVTHNAKAAKVHRGNQAAIRKGLVKAGVDIVHGAEDLATHPGKIPEAIYEHPVTAASIIAPALGAVGKASGIGAKAADIGAAAAAAGRTAEAGPVARAAARVGDAVDAYNVRKAADLAAQAGRAEGETAAARAARPLAKAAKGATKAERETASAVRRGIVKAAPPKSVKIAEAIQEGDKFLAGNQVADKGSQAKVIMRELHQFNIDHPQDVARELAVKRAQKLFDLDEGQARVTVQTAEKMLAKKGEVQPPVPKVEPDTATPGGAAQAERQATAEAAAKARRSEGAKKAAATRKANAEAAKAAPVEPQYPAGTRFHGTSKPIDKLGLTFDRPQSQNLYGPGFYTTDNATVAGGYTRKGAGADPHVYSVEWTGEKPPKLLDLDEKPNADLLDALATQMAYTDGSGTAAEIAAARARLAKTATGRDAYAMFKETLADAGVTKSDADEVMDSVSYNLENAGYDGFRHTGGAGSGPGKVPHDVQIYFHPVDQYTGEPRVKLTPVGGKAEPAAAPPALKPGSAGERGAFIFGNPFARAKAKPDVGVGLPRSTFDEVTTDPEYAQYLKLRMDQAARRWAGSHGRAAQNLGDLDNLSADKLEAAIADLVNEQKASGLRNPDKLDYLTEGVKANLGLDTSLSPETERFLRNRSAIEGWDYDKTRAAKDAAYDVLQARASRAQGLPPRDVAAGIRSARERGAAIFGNPFARADDTPIDVPPGLEGYYPGTGAPVSTGAKARPLGMKASTPYDRQFTGASFENETMDPDAVAAFLRRYNAEGRKQSYNKGLDYLFETLGKPVEGEAAPAGYATPEAYGAFAQRMREKIGLDPRAKYAPDDIAAYAEDPFASIPDATVEPQTAIPQAALQRFQQHFEPRARTPVERGLGFWWRGLTGGPGSGYGLSALMSSTFGNASTYARQAETPFGVRGLARMLNPELRNAVPDTFLQPPNITRLGYDLGHPNAVPTWGGKVMDALASGDVPGGEKVTRPLREALFDLNNRGDNFFRRAMALDRGPGTPEEWQALSGPDKLKLLEGVNSLGGYATLGPGERRAADLLPFLSVRKQGLKNMLPFFNPWGYAAMAPLAKVGNEVHDTAEQAAGVPADYDTHPANARFNFGIPYTDAAGTVRYNQTGARYIDANDAVRAAEDGGRGFIRWLATPATTPLSYLMGEDIGTGRAYTSPDVTYINGRPVRMGADGRPEQALPVHPHPLRLLVQQLPALNAQMQQYEAGTGRVPYDTDFPFFPSGRLDYQGKPMTPYAPKVPLAGDPLTRTLGFLGNVVNPPGLEYRPDNEKVWGRSNNVKAIRRLRLQLQQAPR
jgi:hypothetical protein